MLPDPCMMGRSRSKVFGALIAAVGVVGLVAGAHANEPRGEIEVTGVIEAISGTCPDLELVVAGQRVATDVATEFDDGDCGDLRDGLEVEVEGSVREDGVIQASEVDLR
jgi:hypothetical protein